jgi:2-polyprenyl-3-methyl-5-hydroxy-6-metoxy-1,4-benzoquinol methylase
MTSCFIEKFQVSNGIFHKDLKDSVSKKISTFYNDMPFPDYENNESLDRFREKGNKNIFIKKLKDFIGFDKKILEVGCGTGQVSNYLALDNNSEVYGIDLAVNSLKLATEFAKKNNVNNTFFCNADLFDDVFKKKSFDFIYCSGVLHHTSAPKEGFKQLVSLLKDDGCIVIGLYNFYGRFWTKLKAIIFKLNIFKKNAFLLDDKLKEFKRGSKKYNSWFNDQFNHPLESVHTFDEVLLWFKECNIELIFSLPSTTFFDEINFNSRQDKSNFIIRTFKQIFMLFNIWGKEGGLFIFVGKKNVRN